VKRFEHARLARVVLADQYGDPVEVDREFLDPAKILNLKGR
jgi:hypothetical protein